MTRHTTRHIIIGGIELKDLLKRIVNRYLIEGLSGMALGLFSTLIVGLILKQIGEYSGISQLIWFGSFATVLTGTGIGVGVAHKFKAPPLVMYSSAVAGLIGAYASKIITLEAFSGNNIILIGPGEPLGAFVAAIVAIELGMIVSGKTKLDILITPITTIVTGGFAGILVGPTISKFMMYVGNIIIISTEQAPLVMGALVAVIMGMVLTLPISSAALSIILGLNGLAAGAATVGCATQMIGFAVASYRENGINGLLAQGLGTSMLQVPNIVKKPVIWLPPIIASALLGPLATVVFKMSNNPYGAGMGTSGLVGQIMTWNTMSTASNNQTLFLMIIILHFLLPAVLTLLISEIMRKKGWIKFGDLKLEL